MQLQSTSGGANSSSSCSSSFSKTVNQGEYAQRLHTSGRQTPHVLPPARLTLLSPRYSCSAARRSALPSARFLPFNHAPPATTKSSTLLTLPASTPFLASSAANGKVGCETRARKMGSFAGGRREERIAGRYLGIGSERADDILEVLVREEMK